MGPIEVFFYLVMVKRCALETDRISTTQKVVPGLYIYKRSQERNWKFKMHGMDHCVYMTLNAAPKASRPFRALYVLVW